MGEGDFLSRAEILAQTFHTQVVEAFGGRVLVREAPADLIQGFIEAGAIEQTTNAAGETLEQVDLKKVNMIEIAARCIVHHETLKPLFTKRDLVALGSTDFVSIQAVSRAAMAMLADRRMQEPESTDPN